MEPMSPWLAGFLGGLLATVAFTLISYHALDEPPAPAFLFARILRTDPSSVPLLFAGTLSHYAYGAAMSVLFAMVTIQILGWSQQLWAWGLLYGAALALIASIIWGPLSGAAARQGVFTPVGKFRSLAVSTAAHVVYGGLVGLIAQYFAF